MKVHEIACGRAGDKGATLDLTLAAADAGAYERLAAALTPETVAQALGAATVQRYELPRLNALKYVVPDILGGGTYASLRAGMHWQKASIWILLDLDLPEAPDDAA